MHDTTISRGGRLRRVVTAALIACVTPAVAWAHHGMDGETPATFLDGLLSGLAHPVIGLDHLAMILLVGASAAAARHGLAPVLAFVTAGMFGCLAHAARWDLPQAEAGVGASLVLLGLGACALARPRLPLALALLGVFGALHGYAYGESIVGAEPTPLVAYLFGLGVVQCALGALAWRVLRPRHDVSLGAARLAALRALGLAGAAIGAAALL